MAIDFPNTPTSNQIYTVGSRSWKWDGTIWAIYSNNPVLYRQDSPPSSPQEGDQWFETDTGRMFVRYGTAWVELGNATDVAGALQPSQVTSLSAATTLTSDDVFPVVDNPSSAVASSKITYGDLVTNMSSSLAPGLVLIQTASFSAQTSVPVSNCFTSNYANYRIILSIDSVNSSTGRTINMRLRTSGGDDSTAFYNYASQMSYLGGIDFSNATNGGYSATESKLTFHYYSANTSSACLDILNPFDSSKNTGATGLVRGGNASADTTGTFGMSFTSPKSHTGFSIYPSTGTITGSYSVYGYRN